MRAAAHSDHSKSCTSFGAVQWPCKGRPAPVGQMQACKPQSNRFGHPPARTRKQGKERAVGRSPERGRPGLRGRRRAAGLTPSSRCTRSAVAGFPRQRSRGALRAVEPIKPPKVATFGLVDWVRTRCSQFGTLLARSDNWSSFSRKRRWTGRLTRNRRWRSRRVLQLDQLARIPATSALRSFQE